MKYYRALAEEIPFPFEDEYFHTQCSTASSVNDPLVRDYQSFLVAAHIGNACRFIRPLLFYSIALLSDRKSLSTLHLVYS